MLDSPIKDRRTERRLQTRAEIIEAAWEIARADGLASITLRGVAARVGMRAPSLYSYFESKNAIYDAMFAQGWREYLAVEQEAAESAASLADPLAHLRQGMHRFMRFCVADPVRYQLLIQRTIPGFTPSNESYALAVAGLDLIRSRLAALGITDPAAVDLLTAIGTGLSSQQLANDPGGDRWVRLVDQAMEMFYLHVTAQREGSAPTEEKPA